MGRVSESSGAPSGKMADREGLAVVTEIGSTILSSRSPAIIISSTTCPHGNQRAHDKDLSVENEEVRYKEVKSYTLYA